MVIQFLYCFGSFLIMEKSTADRGTFALPGKDFFLSSSWNCVPCSGISCGFLEKRNSEAAMGDSAPFCVKMSLKRQVRSAHGCVARPNPLVQTIEIKRLTQYTYPINNKKFSDCCVTCRWGEDRLCVHMAWEHLSSVSCLPACVLHIPFRARICKPGNGAQESIPSLAGLYDNPICCTAARHATRQSPYLWIFWGDQVSILSLAGRYETLLVVLARQAT